jgi:hypothetical protein
VWLLYNGQPYPAGLPVIAVLYNRPQAWHDPSRDDRWLARPYGPDHKGTELRGMTGEEAARNLWMALPGGGNAAALAAAEAAAVEFECGGGCSDPPLTG